MAKTFFEPAGDHVLVVDGLRETKLDGIELPDNQKQQEMVFGYVIYTGPLALHTHPEDQVAYGPYAGKNVIIEGAQFRLVREGQIEGYIRKSE